MSRLPDFDLVIYGTTAPGIVAAIRAAREGLAVALVSPDRHLGGAFASLGAIETHYAGNRAPLLQEIIARIANHYEQTAGRDSQAWRTCTGGGKVTGGMLTFEPKVAERILEEMIAAEPRITLWRGQEIARIETAAELVRAATFQPLDGGAPWVVRAPAFIEASYEGDFMAAAGAAFRVGREARAEHAEPNAGRVFSRWVNGRHPRAAAEGRLNLLVKGATTEGPLPGSTGEGDARIQSYSYRLCLTDDPDNRCRLSSPPANYDRELYAPILLPPAQKARLALPFHHRFLVSTIEEMVRSDHVFHGHALPHRKRSWNATNFTGGAQAYPTAGRAERAAIARRHLEYALGLMYFLQHDQAVPEKIRGHAAEWGLARDEFAGNGHLPPQLYIREARRLVGRAVFTEHDALLAPEIERAPIHSDSIAITEFSLDSLACSTDRVEGSLCDGQLFQMEVSRPAHVPYGVLLPRALDNLLVVTTVSATHVGWGTIRQTPTLMHLAESAARAVVLAGQQRVAPARLDVGLLQRHLVAHGIMISFFNDFDMTTRADWVGPMQYLGTKGFFGSYDARPNEPLTQAVANCWLRPVARTTDDAGAFARDVEAADHVVSPPIAASAFRACLDGQSEFVASGQPLYRGEACRMVYQVLLRDSAARS